jgi:AraC family transcriptional regulator, regulatory protein of adaptative response / DNA-3-methyladenine glycosylase II
MHFDREACYRAIQTRDARFDGRIFVAVRTTGIYCRPICPARTPKLDHVVFYPSAAAAQEAGFRACLRCRPEAAPDLAIWRGTANTVSRGLALIAEGAVDEKSIGELAERLGVGERQLRRLFHRHVGASPIAVAQTKRILFAKQLLHETRMSMTEVALAAGFGSVRRFNETFHRLYGRPPSALRRAERSAGRPAGITLELRYQPPYDWPAMLAFLRARAIPGVERVTGEGYARTFEIDGRAGAVEVSHARGRDALVATIHLPCVAALPAVVARVRRVFDLGADVGTIAGQLAEDPALASLVRARPGLRVPGGWDGFEIAVRAVLGQQVTVRAARDLAGQVVARHGAAIDPADLPEGTELTRVFPPAERLATADLARLGMPGARSRALGAIAAAAANDPGLFQAGRDLDESIARLRALPGIGEWTAQYVALRALHEPDAFPAADVGLLRAAARLDGAKGRPTAQQLLARAERWRPWRAYAAQHLWTADGSAGPGETRTRGPAEPAARTRRPTRAPRSWRATGTAG